MNQPTSPAHVSAATLSGPTPGSLRAWLLASRPATLSAAVAPVLVGAAVASQFAPLRPVPLLATLLGAALLQIASNFANDVFDFEKGADTKERLGPTRAVQAGLLTAQQMKLGLLTVIVLSLVVGVYITAHAGWPIVVIGLSSIVAAIAYTGGPYPLGYHGFGDVFVFVFFGLVAVVGTTYVQLGSAPLMSFLCAVPVGALATNILVVNNLRDRHTDQLAHKRTLAVRWGRGGALAQYATQLSLSYLLPLALYLLGQASAWVLLPWLSLPLALKLWHGVRTQEGRQLNHVLKATAGLVFVFSLLLALGIYLG
ncbi:MAG TPA: 1,4-dihydroxy-2-naphthoate polyprenyltransferase [Polyangiaceae bacterium]|nr:1,4-dihydroxy-2-naphthoate polyprenyltransferase [Polyangiaceae bacterium]